MRTFRRIGSSIMETLLPTARAQACTPGYCDHAKNRCCKMCTGGVKICASRGSGCADNCFGF